jgi:hypothetical protein
MSTVRLCSAPMIHTPGVIAWAKNGYQLPRDRKNMVRIITESFGLTPECAHDLLSGRVEYTVNEDTVEFDYDGVAVA